MSSGRQSCNSFPVLRLLPLLLALGASMGQSLGGSNGGIIPLTSPAPRLAALANNGPDDCGNRDIARCVEQLEVLTSKDIGFAASREELNNMCPILLSGLQCIDEYTLRCLSVQHRSYFNKLYNGTMLVIKDLCTTRGGRYQQEYIRHAPCMRQVNPKYNRCSEVYHRKTAGLNQAVVRLSERDKARNVITLCCSFQEYLLCSERVVFESCGNETAFFTKNFLNRMAGPIVQDICLMIDFNPRDCFTLPRRAIPHNPITNAQRISQPQETTFSRPALARGTLNINILHNDNDRKTLQHYNSFDITPDVNIPRKVPTRDQHSLQFVGYRNGTRTYRRLRRPGTSSSGWGNLTTADSSAAEDIFTERRNDDSRYIFLRSRDGRKRIKLRRPNRNRAPLDRFSHTRYRPHLRSGSTRGEHLRREFLQENKRQMQIRPIVARRRQHRSRTLPYRRSHLKQQHRDHLTNNHNMTSSHSSVRLRPVKNVTNAKEIAGNFVHKRRRIRFRNRKRMRHAIARLKFRKRTMIRTLFAKLIRDAQRYAYETQHNKSSIVFNRTDIIPEKSYTTTDTSDGTGSDLEDSDYVIVAGEDKLILGNTTLPDFEKFIALLRLKMFAELEETVMSVEGTTHGLDYLSGEGSNIVNPIFIDLADTDFLPPLSPNVTSLMLEDFNFTMADLEDVWFFEEDFNSTEDHAYDNTHHSVPSNWTDHKNMIIHTEVSPSTNVSLNKAKSHQILFQPFPVANETDDFESLEESSSGIFNKDNSRHIISPLSEIDASTSGDELITPLQLINISGDYANNFTHKSENENTSGDFNVKKEISGSKDNENDVQSEAKQFSPNDIAEILQPAMNYTHESDDLSNSLVNNSNIKKIGDYFDAYEAAEEENVFDHYSIIDLSETDENDYDVQELSKIKINKESTGNLKNLPMPLVTLIIGLHIIM